jgi:hypothetical protein
MHTRKPDVYAMALHDEAARYILDHIHAKCVKQTASQIFYRYRITTKENLYVYSGDCNSFSEALPPK